MNRCSVTGRSTAGRRFRGLVLVLLAAVAALSMAFAAPAQAHAPYTALAWGQGSEGTLGNGENTSRDVPVAVSNLSGVTAIASERGSPFYGQALALLESGSVYGWGRNDSGQVGDGTTTNKNVPVAVCAVGQTAPCAKDLEGAQTAEGARAAAASASTSAVLLSSGKVVDWGDNKQGQLGNGSRADSNVSRLARR